MRVVLLGPIAAWWEEWDSPRHQEYTAWRDRVRAELVAAGHLVYSPHRAWQGNWDENAGDVSAQYVNDAAIAITDVCFNLQPVGVSSPGTEHEMDLCQALGREVYWVPPGATGALGVLCGPPPPGGTWR